MTKLGLVASVIAAVLAVPSLAHADSIAVAVTGGHLDSAALADSLSDELGQPVELATGDACRSPCLSIVVGDGKATLLYTGSVVRQRTVELGDDPAQWNTLITLLAGNLVRDEAATLLPEQEKVLGPRSSAIGQNETGRGPEPVPVPDRPLAEARRPETEDPRDVVDHGFPFEIGIVPGISTDLADVHRTHVFAVNAAVGVSRAIRGISVSGAIDVATEDVSGTQIAGAVAYAHDVAGTQVAGAVASARGDVAVQLAGAVATASDVRGVQIGGAISVARDVTGIQVAGAVAVARDTHVQIAGGVAVSRHLTGLQIAPINIATRNDGLQIGVLNIGGGPDGTSLGLINIVPGGRTDIEADVDADRIGSVLFRHGSRRWHNVYGVAGESITEMPGTANDDLWMYGLGFGPSFKLASLPADLEAICWQVNHGSSHEDHLSILSQLRLSVAVPFGPFKAVIGGTVNAYTSSDRTSPLLRSSMPGTTSRDIETRVWPSLFVGVRI